MTHWKELLEPSIYLSADSDDLKKDVTVTIAKVVREELMGKDGKKHPKGNGKQPTMYFKYNGKPMSKTWFKVPTSVLKGLSILHGDDWENWVDKEVTLYRTKCLSFGKIDTCIRIRFDPKTRAGVIAYLKKQGSSERVFEVVENKSN